MGHAMIRNVRQVNRRWPIAVGLSCGVAIGLINCAGCSTFSWRGSAVGLPTNLGTSPFVESQLAENLSVPFASTAIQQVNHNESVPESTAIYENHFTDVDSSSYGAEYEAVPAPENCPSEEINVYGNSNCQISSCAARPNGQSLCFDPQEYLFDGGDRDPRVTVQPNGTILGLNAEDTVVHYEMMDGEQCVATTNRVPIYAPRFGAVRKVSGTMLAERSVGPRPILAPVGPSAFKDTGLAKIVALPVGPKGQESVKLIDSFRDRNRGIPAESVLPPIPVSDALAPLVNLNFFRTGRMEESEAAALGRLLANARTWSHPESLVVAIDGRAALQTVDSKGAQEVYIYEIPPGGCSLRVCKAASHIVAEPGDIIQFTLRFDNVGALPVKKATITDSLSTRLEYIDGSQQSSLKAKFIIEENDAGSSVLKWEIDSHLKTGEGGAVQFRCRVR